MKAPDDSVRPGVNAGHAPVAFRRALVGAVAILACTLQIGAARAEVKLLPPEQAFRYGARAVDASTVEAQFRIADGYYLYRDKLRFGIEPESATLASPALPPGKVKDDEFFGKVETYRDRVVVRIAVAGMSPGQSVTLRADSQGCADVGVCYPPTSQKIVVVVPAAGTGTGPFVEATPEKKRWFQ